MAKRLRVTAALSTVVIPLMLIGPASSTPVAVVHEEASLSIEDQKRQTAVALLKWSAGLPEDTFGGVWIDDAAVHLQVTRPLTATEEGAAMTAAPSPSLVEIELVRYSRAHLEELHSTIVAAQDELRVLGADVLSVGHRPSTNKVAIGLRHDTPAARSVLEERFGTDTLTFKESRPKPLAREGGGPPLEGWDRPSGRFRLRGGWPGSGLSVHSGLRDAVGRD